MRTGSDNKAARAEDDVAALDQRRDLLRREAAPDGGPEAEIDAGGQRAVAQRGALAELAIRRGVGVAFRERLEVLATGSIAFIEHDDAGAGFRRGDGRRQSRGAGTDDEDVAALLLRLVFGDGRERRGLRGRRALDAHPGFDLREAGALAGATVDGDEAVEAGAHAAMQAARRTGCRIPQRQHAGGAERGGDGLARQRGNRAPIEGDAHRFGTGAYFRVGQSHGWA